MDQAPIIPPITPTDLVRGVPRAPLPPISWGYWTTPLQGPKWAEVLYFIGGEEVKRRKIK